MARIKRLIEKIVPAPRSLADACGEARDEGESAPDVAHRRDVFNKKYEGCCGALARHEPCSRPVPTRCDEAAKGPAVSQAD